MDTYVQLVERISQASGLSVEDIERKVEAKRAKLSGLVSKEGAAQIVAAELGIHFDKERMKIAELVQGMKRANILGKVLQLFPVRSFTKNGRDGKVANLLVGDSSASIKVVLWDTNHIGLIEAGKIKEGDVLEISHGSLRNGELHVSAFGDIKLSKEILDHVVTTMTFPAMLLAEAKPGQRLQTRAFIVQVFDPRYFEVCPECGKKVVDEECAVHGTVTPKKRALLNVILDDGSESLRSVLFGDQIYLLGLTEDEVFSLEHFVEKKQQLLGEERIFSGQVRSNALYNTTEFTIEQVSEVQVDPLLKALEAKALA